MRCAILLWLLGTAALAGGQVEPEQAYCQRATADVQHGDALSQACEFALTLHRKLPNILCQRTIKSYAGGSAFQTVTAEVRHENGRDSYSHVTRNGKPFTEPMSHLPGSWTEGEFGSILSLIFAEESHSRYKFEKETRWKSASALLFEFQLERENNHGWYVEANGQKILPGFKGKIWVDERSHAVLRVEMRAENLEPEADVKAADKNATVQRTNRARRFPLDSVKMSVDYADTLLGDGTQFVLPTTSEDEKCITFRMCIRDVVSFENCHKFGAKARIVEDATQ